MISAILKLLLVAAVTALAYAYYGLVMPDVVALLIAILLGGFALFTLISGQMRFSKIALGGAVFAAWPAGALLAAFVASLFQIELTEAEAAAAAWPLALLAAKASFAMSEKRDKARDIGNLSLGIVAIYSVTAAAWAGSRIALALAALGVAAIAANAAQNLIIPPRLEAFLYNSAKVAGVACLILSVEAFIFR